MLRGIRDDLVEKRLWPVALVLLLGLIASPVLALRATNGAVKDPPSPSAPAPAVKQTPAAQTPANLTATPKQTPPAGEYHDPFRNAQGAGAASKSTAGVATTVTPSGTKTSSGSSGSPSSSGSSASTVSSSSSSPSSSTTSSGRCATCPVSAAPAVPSGGSSASTTSATRTAPADAGRYAAGFRLDADWGPVADPRSIDGVTRMQIFKAEGQPQIVYLGVRPDGKHALFMISMQHVSATGDGRCLPDPDHCHLVEMAAGDTEMIDIPTSVGMQQYSLVVDHLRARHAATFEQATALRKKVVKAGSKLVADRINAGFNFVRRFTYAARRGVLVYHP